MTYETVHTRADLDHTNEEVRASLIDWMSWLKSEIGYAGWRFDFTKVLKPRAPSQLHLRLSAVYRGVWDRSTHQYWDIEHGAGLLLLDLLF